MAFKKDKKGSPKLLTKKEKIQLITGETTINEVFEHSPNLQVSFFPNGSDRIWLKDKTDFKLGLEIGFALGDRGLLVQVRRFGFTKEIYIEDLTQDIKEVIQLKGEKEA